MNLKYGDLDTSAYVSGHDWIYSSIVSHVHFLRYIYALTLSRLHLSKFPRLFPIAGCLVRFYYKYAYCKQ